MTAAVIFRQNSRSLGDPVPAMRIRRLLPSSERNASLFWYVLNGLDAARLIQEFAPEIPIIILSVHKSKQLMEEAQKIGVRGYVTGSVADFLAGIWKSTRRPARQSRTQGV